MSAPDSREPVDSVPKYWPQIVPIRDQIYAAQSAEGDWRVREDQELVLLRANASGLVKGILLEIQQFDPEVKAACESRVFERASYRQVRLPDGSLIYLPDSTELRWGSKVVLTPAETALLMEPRLAEPNPPVSPIPDFIEKPQYKVVRVVYERETANVRYSSEEERRFEYRAVLDDHTGLMMALADGTELARHREFGGRYKKGVDYWKDSPQQRRGLSRWSFRIGSVR